MQLATNFHRFIAFLIDEFLIGVLFWIIFYDDLREISQNSTLINDFVKDKIYYYYALMSMYQIFFIHKYGTTLGKMALKLEILTLCFLFFEFVLLQLSQKR